MRAANARPAALQWRLQYPAAAVTALTATAGPTAVAAGKKIECASTAGSSRCVLVGLNANTIANGVVANIVVKLATNVAGASIPLTVSNPLTASTAGDAIATTSTSGLITIGTQPPNSIECSGASIDPPVVQAPNSLISATFAFKSEANCAWKALSNRPWLQVYPLSGNGPSAVEYTVFPNFTTTQRFGTINVAGKEFTVTQAQNPENQNRRLIGKLYFNYLGRIGGIDEIQFQITEGLNKGVPPAKIVENFFRTAEFDLGGRFIAGLYVGLLNRVPEYSGWLFQRNALAAGRVNQRDLVANFLDSGEFALKYGTLDNPALVRLLYRQVLLREPSQDEIAFQVQALQQGVVDRVGIANAFLNSNEFRDGTAPLITTFLLYATLLQRDATSPELVSGTTQFEAGRTVFDFSSFLINSVEFTASLN
jgi:hypothetical protein